MSNKKNPVNLLVGSFLVGGCFIMLATFIWFTMEQGKERAHTHVEAPASALDQALSNDIVALMQKVQDDPENAENLKDLGLLFLKVEDWNRAEYFLKQSLAFDPYNASTLSFLGMAQYRMQNYGGAAMTLEMSLTHGKTPEALFNLATIMAYKLDDKARAKALLEDLLKLENIPEQLERLGKSELEKLAQTAN